MSEKKDINETKIEKADQGLIDKINELLEYGYPIKEVAEKTGVTTEFVISNAKTGLYLKSDYPAAVRLQERRDKAE